MRRVAGVLMVLTLAVAGTVRPQAPKFETATEVVAVPVVVLDGPGRAVAGLGADDFEVLEGGRPRPIVAFQAVDALAEPPAEPTAAPLVLQTVARRQFLFLFDLSFSPPGRLTLARRAAARLVEEKLGPRDLVAVATCSTRFGLKLLVGFTPDRDQVLRALQTLGVSRKPDPSDPLGLTFEAASGPPVASGWDAGENDVQDEGLETGPQLHEFQAQRFLENLRDAGRALGQVQGHKQVVLFSGGFQQRTLFASPGAGGAFVSGGVSGVRSDDVFGNPQIRADLDQVLKAFAASDAVVHAVDVTGLAAQGDPSRRGTPTASRQGQESLVAIAEGSGGRIVKDAGDLGAALSEILDVSRRFYVLGFAPEASGRPGRYHEITVRVRTKGLRALHRKGYVEAERPALARLISRTAAAEVLAKGITGGELGVRALAVPYRDALGAPTLSVLMEVEAGAGAALEIYAYAFDGVGRVSDLAAVTSSPTAAPSPAAARFEAATSLRVSPGAHEVRYLVWEPD